MNNDAHAPLQIHDEALRCADGRLLAATWYEPAPELGPVRAVAVVSCAMAVSRGFYRAFAEWLSARGYAVLCYDYRGIGDSLTGKVTAEPARLRDWAKYDMGAALHAAERRRRIEQDAQGAPVALLWVGHSFGGNAVGLVPGAERIDAILGVAAQAADWRFWSGVPRLKTWAFFHLLLPVLTRAFGRAPTWVLGPRAAALPPRAALEWARWGRRRGFMFGDETLRAELGYHRIGATVHLWDVADDHQFGPAAAVDELARRFTAAKLERRTLEPRAIGARAIGHFAPFRRDLGERIWPLLLTPLEAATPALAARLG